MLQWSLELIRRQPIERQQDLLKRTFEAHTRDGETCVSWSCKGGKDSTSVMQFLVEHSPSGIRTLEASDRENGYLPIHDAAQYGNVSALKFIVDHAPSGVELLQREIVSGATPAHIAAHLNHTKTLEFILIHAPLGLGLLDIRTKIFSDTVWDMMSQKTRDYFNEQKLYEIMFRRELQTVYNNYSSFETNSLIVLMFEVIVQETEKLMFLRKLV